MKILNTIFKLFTLITLVFAAIIFFKPRIENYLQEKKMDKIAENSFFICQTDEKPNKEFISYVEDYLYKKQKDSIRIKSASFEKILSGEYIEGADSIKNVLLYITHIDTLAYMRQIENADSFEINDHSLKAIHDKIYNNLLKKDPDCSLVILFDIVSDIIELKPDTLPDNSINSHNFSLLFEPGQSISIVSTNFKSPSLGIKNREGVMGKCIFDLLFSEYQFPDLVYLLDSAQKMTNLFIMEQFINDSLKTLYDPYLKHLEKSQIKEAKKLIAHNLIEQEIIKNNFKVQKFTFFNKGNPEITRIDVLVNKRKLCINSLDDFMYKLVIYKELIYDYDISYSEYKNLSDSVTDVFFEYLIKPEIFFEDIKNYNGEIKKISWDKFYKTLIERPEKDFIAKEFFYTNGNKTSYDFRNEFIKYATIRKY